MTLQIVKTSENRRNQNTRPRKNGLTLQTFQTLNKTVIDFKWIISIYSNTIFIIEESFWQTPFLQVSK